MTLQFARPLKPGFPGAGLLYVHAAPSGPQELVFQTQAAADAWASANRVPVTHQRPILTLRKPVSDAAAEVIAISRNHLEIEQ